MDSGNGPVASSGLEEKLWLSYFLLFFFLETKLRGGVTPFRRKHDRSEMEKKKLQGKGRRGDRLLCILIKRRLYDN